MLGSGINPESFKLDYSGMANAAATQAQGVANLGASIGGAISEVGDYFKKQAEDEKKVQKSLSVAKAIGDLIPGLQPTIQGSLNILNDKELPLSQRTAEADAISDILELGINEVRNRQDVGFKERELGIREAEALARNAPSMPTVNRKRVEKTGVFNGKTLKYDIYVDPNNPSDALYEDGTPVYGVDSQASTAIDTGLNLSMPTAEGTAIPGDGTFPDYGGISEAMVLPPRIDPAAIAAAAELTGGQSDVSNVSPMPMGTPTTTQVPVVDEIPAGQAGGGMIPPGATPVEVKAEEPEGTEMTLAEVEELANKGVKINAVPLGGGKFRVTESTFGNKPMVEVNTAQSSQEGRAKEMDKMLFETKKQLEGASQNKDSITKMVNLLDEGVKTGFAQGAIMQFNKAFGRDVSDSETFKSVAGDVAMGFINLTKGAISDREMTYFTTVLAPNLGNTVEGNKKIGEFMLKAIKKAEKIEKVISEGLSEGRNAFDIDKEVRAIRNADDLLSDTPGGESTPEKPQSATDRLRGLR